MYTCHSMEQVSLFLTRPASHVQPFNNMHLKNCKINCIPDPQTHSQHWIDTAHRHAHFLHISYKPFTGHTIFTHQIQIANKYCIQS